MLQKLLAPAAESGPRWRAGAGRRLIVLDRLVKLTPPDQPRPLLFGPVSGVLPADRVMAVLGRQETGRSTLLRLLGGYQRPDAGQAISRAKFSMILNSSGYLHAGMTGLENVAIMARMHGMNAWSISKLAVELPFVDPALWHMAIGDLEPRTRRSLEMALATLLPYDCYLIDDAERAETNVLAAVIRMLSQRQAGVIFTAYKPRFARQFADCAAVIANQDITVFESVKEAELFYDC